MTTDSPPDLAVGCPSCDALNRPNALVCVGCGVNLAQFPVAAARLRERQREQAEAHAQELAEDATAAVAGEVARGRRQLRVRLGLVLGGAALVALLIVLGAAFQAHQARVREERLAAEYQRATACLEALDYVCAREGFSALLSEEPHYPGAQAELDEARRRLAQEYGQARRWEDAIAELDAVLAISPGDRPALALMKDVYDRWLTDANARGDWLTAIKARWQRDARFPSEVWP